MDMERKEWRDWPVPRLVFRYLIAHDLATYEGSDYLNDEKIGPPKDGDVAVTPVRVTDSGMDVEEVDVCRVTPFAFACGNQILHDYGIVRERHKKGIPMLQICDLKLQYGSEDHVKYSWKLDEAAKGECKLEIDRSDENEQGKKIVKFGFATKDIDKLLSRVVDGYEVKYMLRTDAIRLMLELEIPAPYCNSVWGEVTLEIKQRGGRQTPIYLLRERRPVKRPKLDHNSDGALKLSFTRNVPLYHLHCMYVAARLKDRSGRPFVDRRCAIFPFTVPVDQEEYIYFENGYIKLKVYWGCSSRDGGKGGLCAGVCTCEPAEFVGFHSPGEVCCSKNNEE